MTEFILANEMAIRLGCFLGIFAVIALWEIVSPRRTRALSRWTRWPGNLGIGALNQLFLRVFLPVAAMTLALVVQERNWGLLNNLQMPGWLAIVISVLVFDFVIYLQHVLFHKVPVLWRLHRMHHTDIEFDASTAIRFHPLEIFISMIIKFAAVVALGPPVVSVLLFEVLLNGTALFNHGNIRLPLGLDRVLRWFIVTPDMHRVHHSIIQRETDSNFGFNIPWWDRLLGTYRAQPSAGHDGMTIGIEEFRSGSDSRLDRMLIQPFRGPSGSDSTKREGGEG